MGLANALPLLMAWNFNKFSCRPHSRSKNGVASLAYGGDPVFQSVRALIANAAAYWMPAFAGMTAEFEAGH